MSANSSSTGTSTYHQSSDKISYQIEGNVEYVAYPKGFPDGSSTKQGYQKILDLDKRLELIRKGIPSELHGGVIIQGNPKAYFGIPKQVSHLHLGAQTREAVLKFSRFPQDVDDLSTPFDGQEQRELYRELGVILHISSLPPKAQTVMHESMSLYFSQHKTQGVLEVFDIELILGSYSSGAEIPAHTFFSRLACAIAGRHILGISDMDFDQYYSIWAALFEPHPKQLLSQQASIVDSVCAQVKGLSHSMKQSKASLVDFRGKLYPKLRELVKKRFHEGLEDDAKDIVSFWIREKVPEAVIDGLSPDLRKEAESAAEQERVSLKEKVLIDNCVAILMETQDYFAFLMSELSRRLGRSGELQSKCRHDRQELEKVLNETLRLLPPAGQVRQLRWDTEIRWKTPFTKTPILFIHRMRAGDLVQSHPITVSRCPYRHEKVDQFVKERKEKSLHYPFGKGPHRCPAEAAIKEWMLQNLQVLLERYTIYAKGTMDQRYLVTSTLRAIPEVKLKLTRNK